MDNIQAFLKENAIQKENVKYVASPRFVVDGKPVEWEIKVIDNEAVNAIKKATTKRVPNKMTHTFDTVTDMDAFMLQLVCECVVYPDLNSEELQNSYGVMDAESLVQKMLTPGEYADLTSAVSQAQGFETGMDDKIQAVKNS